MRPDKREAAIAAIRRVSYELVLCGQNGLAQAQPLLTQKTFALAAPPICQCSTFHQTGRSFAPICVNLRLTLCLPSLMQCSSALAAIAQLQRNFSRGNGR